MQGIGHGSVHYFADVQVFQVLFWCSLGISCRQHAEQTCLSSSKATHTRTVRPRWSGAWTPLYYLQKFGKIIFLSRHAWLLGPSELHTSTKKIQTYSKLTMMIIKSKQKINLTDTKQITATWDFQKHSHEVSWAVWKGRADSETFVAKTTPRNINSTEKLSKARQCNRSSRLEFQLISCTETVPDMTKHFFTCN